MSKELFLRSEDLPPWDSWQTESQDCTRGDEGGACNESRLTEQEGLCGNKQPGARMIMSSYVWSKSSYERVVGWEQE